MALDIVGTVGQAIKLSWQIYDKGFSKHNSQSQKFVEFGDALLALNENLTTIKNTVKVLDSDLERKRVGIYGPCRYNLASLENIIGNFRLTLDECDRWLNDRKRFHQSDGVITNILYNINTDPQVVHMTERIAFHNVKIGLVLEPFKMHVQWELAKSQNAQHRIIAGRLQDLEELLAPSASNFQPRKRPPRDLEVPTEIRFRFESAVCLEGHRELQSPEGFSSFPFSDGLQAFFHHFTSISPMVGSIPYVRLMKSIWIMDRIWESSDWAKKKRTDPGCLEEQCLREMDVKLREECSRVANSNLPLPRLDMVLRLPDEAFSIWPSQLNDNAASEQDPLDVLLDFPILPELNSHTLRIVRNIDDTLGVEDKTVAPAESGGSMSRERVISVNINPQSAYFVPIYAMPSELGALKPVLTVKLQSSRDGVNGVMPEFKSKGDLLKLQHLVTGYRCIGQSNWIKVTSLGKGQGLPTKYKGNYQECGSVQFWRKQPYETLQLDAAERRPSGATTPSSGHTSDSLSTFGAPSVISMSSAHTQRVSLGSTVAGIEFRKPEPPLLVLFLKSTEGGRLSFLAIELDEETAVNPNSCDCRSTRKSCKVSVLERLRKPLLARRYHAENGLHEWNLAAIGEHWSSETASPTNVEKMYWLQIAFQTKEEKDSFNKNVAKLVRLFTARMMDYKRDLDSILGKNIITVKA
ncbi:hypothetical protein BDV96DRAFT_109269 [Lophiotrema nucula]|uniref:Uncharacterized protein n=1 Tax=Lophiotrema nucula TaxID=690887 RepID=A0A6A5Z5H2_9PLEO|nr:hypothetical protein BDV96DRAFT_109269 [Lophiotrema nucula]